MELVLSVFPGIDVLGRGFEEEGYCVVRGPDVMWGGDICDFNPPADVFDGVIGGPPCKGDSLLAHLNGEPSIGLFYEFERVIDAARPKWWLMEAVRPHPEIGGHILTLNNRWLGEPQRRQRYFHSNLDLERHIEVVIFENPEYKRIVLAGHGGKEGTVYRRMATYSWPEMCRLQGLPDDYDLPGLTRQAKREAVGNAVPLPMARALARAVKALNNIGPKV